MLRTSPVRTRRLALYEMQSVTNCIPHECYPARVTEIRTVTDFTHPPPEPFYILEVFEDEIRQLNRQFIVMRRGHCLKNGQIQPNGYWVPLNSTRIRPSPWQWRHLTHISMASLYKEDLLVARPT